MTLTSKTTSAAQHTYAASEEEHREHPDVRARRLEGCYDTARRLGNPQCAPADLRAATTPHVAWAIPTMAHGRTRLRSSARPVWCGRTSP